MKKNTHTVLKNEDIDKYLSTEQTNSLIDILQTIASGRDKDGKKIFNEYYVCNTDEPYAEEVLNVILKNEVTKNDD